MYAPVPFPCAKAPVEALSAEVRSVVERMMLDCRSFIRLILLENAIFRKKVILEFATIVKISERFVEIRRARSKKYKYVRNESGKSTSQRV